MYAGLRDPEIHIIVPQNMCEIYQARDNRTFIETFVPPESVYDYKTDTHKWGSIMVAPNQVDILRRGSGYNVIRVNEGARIVCSVKDTFRKVISSEVLLPEDIMGRLLKYHRYVQFYDEFIENDCVDDLDTDAFTIYMDMNKLGQSMEFYMNRLPKRL